MGRSAFGDENTVTSGYSPNYSSPSTSKVINSGTASSPALYAFNITSIAKNWKSDLAMNPNNLTHKIDYGILQKNTNESNNNYGIRFASSDENLLANRLVTDVEFAILPSDTGSSYQCIYNTRKVTGLILRYHTYTDPTSEITYILSETFSPDDQLQTKSLFVFDGDSSFMCTGNDASLTINTALALSSSIVE